MIQDETDEVHDERCARWKTGETMNQMRDENMRESEREREEEHALQTAWVLGEGRRGGSRANGSRIVFCSTCAAYFWVLA